MKSIFTEQYEAILLYLLKARRQAGITQAELAQKLFRPQSFVSKYERGERRLDIIEFARIADILGISTKELLVILQSIVTQPRKLRGPR